MASIAPYSLPQTVFMLSLGSNGLFGLSDDTLTLARSIEAFLGTSESAPGTFFQLVNASNAAYPCLANESGESGVDGDWRTVWGPVVFQAADNEGATNMMFVAHSPSMSVYVVAIAGTNPLGTNALLFQDLDVQPADMVAWPPKTDVTQSPPAITWTPSPNPDATTAAIAKGTSDGITRLYQMLDPVSGVPLQTYLQSVEDSGSTLIFTGHSLGGALAPMMALLLYPLKTPKWQDVFILATAGPTPGNAAIAGLFATTYPQTATNAPTAASPASATFEYWNTDYANSNDVVPRAWSALSGLVTPSLIPTDDWKTFFGGGASLTPDFGGVLLATIDASCLRAGYSNGTTPYYTPALTHYPFTGTWGDWQWTPAGGPYAYPAAWAPETVPMVFSSLTELAPYILDAHLSQYAQAFLGFPGPKNPPAVPG